MTERTTPIAGMVPPAGASLWERRLFDHLTEHIKQERGILKEYAGAAQSTDSKALAYLINLIIDDELRHHHLFKQLAESLTASAEFQADPAVPRIDFARQDVAPILEVTKRLLKHEESDARELKNLQRELYEVRDTTLWGVLVELMQRDTEKHMAILRFIVRHAHRSMR